MALKQQLHQKQVQKLTLSPALQQAIKLLPLTNLELIEVIDTELSQNPMLEIIEEVPEAQGEGSGLEEKLEGGGDLGMDKENIEEDALNFEAYFHEDLDSEFRSFFAEKKEALALENFVSKSTSLWDHLNWQANLTFFEEREREIAQYLIGNIAEDGYLTITVEEAAQALQITEAKVEEIREKIKRFDPVGVGSLNLKETLLTQMEYFEITDEITLKIVNHFLPLLEKSDFSQLAKELGISLAKVKMHLEVVKGLEPTPGRKYNDEKASYVVPDIIVKKEDEELRVILNDEGLPKLRINSFYRKVLAQATQGNSEARLFLKEKLKKAFWFLRSIDQRNQTIYKVAKFLVDRQRDFIEKGIEYIKPLTLIEAAQEIGVHESTVGRVVANKYILMPRGVFPLKYFFHKSLSGDNGEEVSSLRVKEHIKKLIETEDKKNPLSDIEIEEILAKENFRIARRTVAKYRKQLRILPSYIRKRNYWMEGDG